MPLNQQTTPVSAIASPQRLQTKDASSPTNRHPLDYDLVIVGGGLVGLTFAHALKESGLRIALIEAQVQSSSVAKGQAYHINLLSSRIFQGMGLWEQMRPGMNPIDHIRLSDAEHPGVVQFVQQDLQTDVLGYVAEHRVVLEALQTSIAACSHLTYLCPATVVNVQYHSDRVAIDLNQAGEIRQIQTQLLVAADGARSPIRQQAGIRTQGWPYWQSCVVAFIQPEKSHNNVAYERFWPSGPFAILPLPNNLCRIVWTVSRQDADALLIMEEADFLARLKQRYGDQMGNLALVGDRYVFQVQLMHSIRYTQSRLALIGDAAHGCHPVGGQGVNLGIRDAAALAQVLTLAHQQGLDIGDRTVLRQYERWRKLETLAILACTDILVRLFSTNSLPLVILRRLGLWGLRRIHPLKVMALRLMTGLTGRTPNLAQR
jgi:2-octaprenyl-6-methoxyphenol hydroxylase